MGFKERLKEARENKGLKQIELSKMIGLSRNVVSNYENGTSYPNIDVLYKLLDILDVDANFLLQDECDINSDVTKAFTKLEDNFYSLNSDGKLKLIDYSEVLLGNPKYKKEV